MTAPRFELTSQRQKVSRLPTEPPGRDQVCIYVCMVWSSHIAEYGSTGYGLKKNQNAPRPMVAIPAHGQLNRENYHFPVPIRARDFWSRETGSDIPSRVSLLILHTQAKSGTKSPDSSRFPRRRPFIYTAIRHRVSPEFIRPRNCVSMAFPSKSPPAQGQ